MSPLGALVSRREALQLQGAAVRKDVARKAGPPTVPDRRGWGGASCACLGTLLISWTAGLSQQLRR